MLSVGLKEQEKVMPAQRSNEYLTSLTGDIFRPNTGSLEGPDFRRHSSETEVYPIAVF